MQKTAKVVSAELKKLATPERAAASMRFFKTGPGQYGEGDIFIGLRVPQIRNIVKTFQDLSLDETEKLLHSPIHEERLTALLILVAQFKKDPRKEIVELYLKNTAFINNWDLVDSSAAYIVGPYFYKDTRLLYTLARSQNLWERRIAMIATFHFIRQGDSTDALKIAEILLSDSHDLMHKAVGWMLREIGKNCGKEVLEDFLRKNYQALPRTALRYAIERFPEKERKAWLKGPLVIADLQTAA